MLHKCWISIKDLNVVCWLYRNSNLDLCCSNLKTSFPKHNFFFTQMQHKQRVSKNKSIAFVLLWIHWSERGTRCGCLRFKYHQLRGSKSLFGQRSSWSPGQTHRSQGFWLQSLYQKVVGELGSWTLLYRQGTASLQSNGFTLYTISAHKEMLNVIFICNAWLYIKPLLVCNIKHIWQV